MSVENGETKVVSQHLIQSMLDSGADQLHMVIRDGKWDIPSFFGSKINDQLPVCYHMAEVGYGVPFTVNQAYPFVKDHIVLLGFPDILFEPTNAFASLITELNRSDAQIVLGVFPIDRPEKWDMVELDENNKVQRIIIKPLEGTYKHGWVMAAWKPEFSRFLNNYITDSLESNSDEQLKKTELHFGHAIIAAMDLGMHVQAVVFDQGKCIDTGTPEEMKSVSEF